jgi:hypothetical protein
VDLLIYYCSTDSRANNGPKIRLEAPKQQDVIVGETVPPKYGSHGTREFMSYKRRSDQDFFRRDRMGIPDMHDLKRNNCGVRHLSSGVEYLTSY